MMTQFTERAQDIASSPLDANQKLIANLAEDDPSKVVAALREVAEEMSRQDAKWGIQDHPDGTGQWVHEQTSAYLARESCQKADAAGEVTWRHILREEYYEALAESVPGRLRAELLQVAAVAVAWIEAIDRRERATALEQARALPVADGSFGAVVHEQSGLKGTSKDEGQERSEENEG